MQSSLINFLKQYKLYQKPLLLAVSGGSDSVALLRLAKETGLAISVGHLDHTLRFTSKEDASFVKQLCLDLDVPFYSKRIEVAKIAKEKKWNLEDAARRLRYAYLSKVAMHIKANAILTAHTLDDQAETVLMQLLRGAAYVTGISEKQAKVVRPLLGVTRKELQQYLSAINQDYRTDESNQDTTKTRAWLRHEVLPKLELRYPTIKHTLAQYAAIQQDQKVNFQKQAQRFMGNHSSASIDKLHTLDIALQREIISSLAGPLDFEHIEAVRKRLFDTKATRISLPNKRTARIAYGSLNIVKAKKKVQLNKPFEALSKTWLEQIAKLVDLESLEVFKPLELRHRKAGDTIQLSGGTKKVSDLLIDLKIPREERDAIPMLASEKNVLWIQDIAADVRVAKPFHDPDIHWMRRALDVANEAVKHKDLPVGCIIVKDHEILSEAFNQTESDKRPFAHAEVLAMQRASEKLGDWRLEGCALYVTLEPCPMCFGAMVQAHVSRVIYGAKNTRDGALGSVIAMQDAPWKHSIEIRGGVLEKSCSQLLSEFFSHRRKA